MQNAIKREIKRLAKRAIAKCQKIENNDKEYRAQYEKRTGLVAKLPKDRRVWKKPNHFQPIYCLRNANLLSKVIWHKVLTLQYDPEPAIAYDLPKPDGSKRTVMAFTIPDAALANVVLRRARDRNIKRLSPSSYAYHPQKDVFDAILDLKNFEPEGKLFAIQIDFEKYFDSIPSKYLKEKISPNANVSLTVHERYVFERFLHHKYANIDSYEENRFQRRFRGTPQGASISLLLANLANHDLDVSLAAAPGKFVRFADDVVALCSTYGEAQEIERRFLVHCKNSGLILNYKKSPGISIISDYNEEMRRYSHFNYLGYRFSRSGLDIPRNTVAKIKSKISRLINLYLIYYLRDGFNANRSGSNYDWDLLGLIYELRNSLYGGLSESELSAFIYRGIKLRRMRGLMGFYCLIDNPRALRELDGWMITMVRRGMAKRRSILRAKYGGVCPTPGDVSLIKGTWFDETAWQGTDLPDPTMPSLVRGWRASRKFMFTFGLQEIQAPSYGNYSDVSALFDY